MELNYSNNFSTTGICESCDRQYEWPTTIDSICDYIRRKISSRDYQDSTIVTIDGIQVPQLKTRTKLGDENDKYWVEAKLNDSKKGPQLVIYAGEKGVSNKVQLFANIGQEKLSFDHKDRKPEEIFTNVTVTFPSGKKMSIERAE
jgi:hypothetical protein